MVLHECTKCGYSTSNSSNFKRHFNQCDPDKPPTNRKKVHKCDECDIVFAFKSGLCKHNRRFHSEDSGTHHRVVPQATVRLGVTDFDKTCCDEVIKYISESPSAQARIQEAFEVGCLHEELTRITHFTGPSWSRNVMGIDMRGTTMKVWCEGKIIRTDATQGVNMIASRNVQLANHPVMRDILGVDDEVPVIVNARTARQRAYESLRIRLVIDNGGTYIMAPRSSPSEPKERVPRIAWSPRVRNSVAAQQGWQCNICNDMLSSCFDIDHQVPLFKGGADSYENLQALCVPCHRNKTAVERTKNTVVIS
jgi:5-methylcytosine-specific restriction endonuclease McrA